MTVFGKRFGTGAAAVLISGAGLFLGTPASALAAAPVTCGGLTATQAAAAGYNVIDDSGQPGPAVVNGTSGNDWIYGTPLADTLNGAGGDDIICGAGDADTLIGGTGDDRLHGDDAADILYGDELGSGTGKTGDGDDKLFGGNGSDTLFGNGGSDTLRGDANPKNGRDSGDGGDGSDTCTTLEGAPSSSSSTGPVNCELP